MIEQAQVGALQIARISLGPMGPLVPELNAFNLPFVFRDAGAHDQGRDRPDRRRDAEEALRSSDREPDRPVLDERRHAQRLQQQEADQDDGRPQGSEDPHDGQPDLRRHHERAWAATASRWATTSSSTRCRPASSTARRTTSRATSSGQHYRYAKYYSMTQHLIIPEILVFSKRTWATLSKEDQDLIMKEAKAAQTEQWTLWAEMEKKSIDDMKANGVEIIEARQQAAMADAVKKAVYEKHAKPLHAVHRARPGREVTDCVHVNRAGRLLEDRAGPLSWGRGTGNEGPIRPGDGCAASPLHDHRRLLPRRDHADDPVGRVHALRAQQRLVVARADGRADDDLVLVPLRLHLLSREPAHRRRRHPDDARRQGQDRDRLADRALHDGHQPVHVLVGHQARARPPGISRSPISPGTRSARPTCPSRSAA